MTSYQETSYTTERRVKSPALLTDVYMSKGHSENNVTDPYLGHLKFDVFLNAENRGTYSEKTYCAPFRHFVTFMLGTYIH